MMFRLIDMPDRDDRGGPRRMAAASARESAAIPRRSSTPRGLAEIPSQR
jgi:hypothetical protein